MTRVHSVRRCVVLAAALLAIAAVASGAGARCRKRASGRIAQVSGRQQAVHGGGRASACRGRGLRDPAAGRKRCRRRRSPCSSCWVSSNRRTPVSAAGRSCWFTTRNATSSSRTTGAKRRPARQAPDRFLDKEGKPLQFYDAVVGGKIGRRAGSRRAARGRATGVMASSHGQSSSSRRSSSPRTAFRSRSALQRDGRGRGAPRRNLARVPISTTSSAIRLPPGRRSRIRRTRQRCARSRRGGAKAFYEGEIARDIVTTVTAARDESRRHDACRSRRLPGQGARARLRHLSGLPGLRNAAAVLGRTDGAADARHSRALRR